MTTASSIPKSEVGELRPSQILHTFGVGSIVDLPNFSALVMGLEDWPIGRSTELGEERLLACVQTILGPQVKRLLTPPRAEEAAHGQGNWFDESHTVGVPVAPFPRWMVCTACRLLAPLSSGLFEFKVYPYRPDKAGYVHSICNKSRKPARVVPARFLVACNKGHLDDFPWLEYVHRGSTGCPGPLRLYELGPSGEASDVEVACDRCQNRRRMAEAFGRENQANMPPCRGRRPHLRDFDPRGCDEEHVTPILQGASNSWFPVIVSVLSIPRTTNKLGQLVDEYWHVLEKATSQEVISAFRQIGQLQDFSSYTDAQVWEAVQERRRQDPQQTTEAVDPRILEWQVFSTSQSTCDNRDFRLRAVEPPERYSSFFEKVVLVEKLREVRALIGFTRLASARDFDTPLELPEEQRAPLSRQSPTWVPAAETRGEGVFFQFSESVVEAWTKSAGRLADEFTVAHRQWRTARGLDPSSGFPGLRYFLLHSFAHAVIRQLAVECGYNTASLGERIYSRNPSEEDGPMAGVLIYTSAPDSEGTLGGLCSLGLPHQLGGHLDQALERIRFCASDPLCAEHQPFRDTTLHGAACHACAFLPETSCERGNRYLDRAVLVGTVQRSEFAFFTDR